MPTSESVLADSTAGLTPSAGSTGVTAKTWSPKPVARPATTSLSILQEDP